MAEPLPRAAFDALMERAGLTDMTPDERDDIRLATRHAAGFAARVREAGPALGVEAEPAAMFTLWEPRR